MVGMYGRRMVECNRKGVVARNAKRMPEDVFQAFRSASAANESQTSIEIRRLNVRVCDVDRTV